MELRKEFETKLRIEGVELLGGPIYAEGPYAVHVGRVPTDKNQDIPHYLVVNTTYGVVEGSTSRLFEARGICQAFRKELEQQDLYLAKDMDIVEQVDEPDGNVDPEFPKKKDIKWKN